MVLASGFSTYTSFPAWQARTVGKACQWSGVAMSTTSTSLRSRTRRKSFTVSGFLPRFVSQISTPLAILASSTSQSTAQSTSGLRKKHSKSPCPMPPQPMRPSRTLSLGPGSAARTERTKGEVRLLAASGARLAAKADFPRNLPREMWVILLTSDDGLRNTVPLLKRGESATQLDFPSSRIARTDWHDQGTWWAGDCSWVPSGAAQRRRGRKQSSGSWMLLGFVFSDQNHAVDHLVGITGVEGHFHLLAVLVRPLLNAVNLGFAQGTTGQFQEIIPSKRRIEDLGFSRL